LLTRYTLHRGAKSYEPFLHVERAELAKVTGDEATRQCELREAHRLFMEIGASIRAAEVAKELVSETLLLPGPLTRRARSSARTDDPSAENFWHSGSGEV
jgi:hypothetical protein